MKNSNIVIGVTLLEMMVVIAVIAILATIAAPSFQDLIRDNRTSAHARELGALLAFARSEALRRNGNVEVLIGVDRADVCLASPCGNGNAIRSVEFDRVMVSAAPPDLEADPPVQPPFDLAFTNRGYIDPFRPLAFRVSHEGCREDRPRESRTFRLERTGQLSILPGGGCP